MQLATEPFRSRRTWPTGVRRLGPWQLKTYAISAQRGEGELDAVVTESAWRYAQRQLGSGALTPDSDARGYGFLVLHEGRDAVWLLVDLWSADVLHHHIFHAPLDAPTDFGSPPFPGSAACAWELAVIAHERDAWVKHVLTRPQAPDFDAYLEDGIELPAGAPVS